jgi:hypothetical protein
MDLIESYKHKELAKKWGSIVICFSNLLVVIALLRVIKLSLDIYYYHTHLES